jgi:hypothetical protein
VLLRVSSFPTSSRNRKSRSTDIEPRFVLGISYLSRQRRHHTTFLEPGELGYEPDYDAQNHKHGSMAGTTDSTED